MSRNGSGTYNLPTNSWNPATNGVSATAADWQTVANDLASALTQSVSSDGQTPMTGNLVMGSNKITGLASATGNGQALAYGQAGASLNGLTLTGALSGALNVSGTSTMTGAAANIAAEVDVASASTADIGGAASNQIRITGTTAITSFGSTFTGPRYIRFGGALTLTYNASSLIVPGAANITTAAGDTCTVLPLPAGAGWIVTNYVRGAVQPLAIATQADMESASSAVVAVPPSLVKNSPFVAKAWGFISNNGTATLTANAGITSINRSATGLITVTMTTAMSSVNYAVVGAGSSGGCTINFATLGLSTFVLNTRNGANSDSDINCYFVVYGDQ